MMSVKLCFVIVSPYIGEISVINDGTVELFCVVLDNLVRLLSNHRSGTLCDATQGQLSSQIIARDQKIYALFLGLT